MLTVLPPLRLFLPIGLLALPGARAAFRLPSTAFLGTYLVALVAAFFGGTSAEAHRAGLVRVEQAGAKPTNWVQLACELQRDWARGDRADVPGDSLRVASCRPA